MALLEWACQNGREHAQHQNGSCEDMGKWAHGIKGKRIRAFDPDWPCRQSARGERPAHRSYLA
jgi:hypothetical protein